MDINVHDQWACESQGSIQDRTREHLATSDKGIMAYRRLLVDAIEKVGSGGTAPWRPDEASAPRWIGPASYDGVNRGGVDSLTYWQDGDEKRRAASTWARS